MNLSDYQRKSKRTLNMELNIRDNIANMMMGIQGESGEVADVIKKHLYQGHNLDIGHIEEELGDTLFYIVNLCNLLGLELEEIIEGNYNKLMQRYPEGFEVDRSVNRIEQQ